MAFDGFINKSVVTELNTCLIGGKINKVYQPNKDEIILNIYSNSNNYNLDICINSNNCRINLTSYKKANPKQASAFCMLLRKHLIGGKITSINSIGLDRIIVINIKTYNELNDIINKKIVIELMGKHSNFILLNDKDIIIDSSRHICSDRNILPANPYLFPKNLKLNINEISKDDFINKIKLYDGTFANALSTSFNGFSKVLINFIIKELNININNITVNDYSIFYDYIIKLIDNISLLNVKCYNFSFNNKEDYVLISYENSSNLEVNSFLDNYYHMKENNENFQNYKNNILKLLLTSLKKYEKRLNNINSKLEECNDMDKYKLYGELITANLYKINNNLNVENIVLENYYDNNSPINIKLDKKFSPAINAKRFFKKYNKLKNTLEIVSKQKSETKNELDYIQSIIYSLDTATSIDELDDIYLEVQENILNKVNKKVERKKDTNNITPHIIDEYKVYIGKNNKQNDYITFKVASKNDIWFHTKDIQGSHVVLSIDNNKDINDDIIVKCASIAAFNSKARSSSKVEVQYTQIKNIKKPKNAKPGFVVFNTYKSTIVKPYKFE